MRTPSPALIVSVIALVVAASGSAYAVGRSTGGTITACQNKKTGVLAVKKKCAKAEATVSWAAVGPLGPQGPNGPQGSQGPQGPQGALGAQGKDGSIWNPCRLVMTGGHKADHQGMRCSGSYRFWDINDWRTGSWSNAIYSGSDFSGSDFTKTDFPYEATFSGVNFSGATLFGANLSGFFRGANFTGANMRESSFNSEIGSAYGFKGANFTNADLTDATGRPLITNAVWNNTTCPDGIVRSTPCW